MRYRKLTAGGDRVFGRGLQNFWIDVPEAVSQAVFTAFRLNLGEWFIDTTAGVNWGAFPLLGQFAVQDQPGVLGKYSQASRDMVIRNTILDAPGVNSIISYSGSMDPDTRKFSVQANIDTVYGPVSISVPTNQ